MFHLKSVWKSYLSILFKNKTTILFKNKFILHSSEVVSLVKILSPHLNITFWYLLFLMIKHIMCHFIFIAENKNWQTSIVPILSLTVFSLNSVWNSIYQNVNSRFSHILRILVAAFMLILPVIIFILLSELNCKKDRQIQLSERKSYHHIMEHKHWMRASAKDLFTLAFKSLIRS